MHLTTNWISRRSSLATILMVFVAFGSMFGQTNPAPQVLPYAQDFGSAAFTSLPGGVAAWNGMSGAAILSQSAAEAAVPAGDAVVKTASAVQSTGGIYGYAANGNAMIYLQGSNNATNGVNELAVAVTTNGASAVKISYKIAMLFPSSRTAGVVLQWRAGASGQWSTIAGSAYEGNSTTRTAGQVNAFTDLQLPAEAENKDTVQLRWAFWHGIETGTVSGIGIDDISIYAGTGNSAPVPPTLSALADHAVNQPLSVQVSWNASSSATSYRLQVAANQGFDPVLLDSANIAGLSCGISGLANNSVYYWRVSASNALGSSAFSPSRSFSTAWTTAPTVPATLSPANGSTGSSMNPVLSWTATAGTMTYRCQVAADSLFTQVATEDSTLSTPQMQAKGLAANSTYWWRVQARNTAGASAYSPAWSFTTSSAYKVPQQILFADQTGQTLTNSVTASYSVTTSLGYDLARDKLYGEIDKVGDTLKCVYTGFPCYMPPGVAPRTAATNGHINAEHSFPQSLGAETGNANSDMHHIYPSKDNVNSARGNYPYAELTDASVQTWYRLAESSSTKPAADDAEYSKFSGSSFEPRDAHKGHVARAIFYFYTVYRAQASASFFEGMKTTLLKWHSQFPVDSTEYARTIKIKAYQGNANPFILDTTLVRRIYSTPTAVTLAATAVPVSMTLEQNFPNPFNPATMIRFSVPEMRRVTLKVYDVLGRAVSTVVDETKAPGSYAVEWNASSLPSGMYFYRLEEGRSTLTRKLVVQK
jgi:hypothetical protein